VFWGRWKAFARRAAQVQSRVLLWVLYYLLLVPIALVQHGGRGAWRRHDVPPSWKPRTTRTSDMASARRQF
jgi:hypothetical protein